MWGIKLKNNDLYLDRDGDLTPKVPLTMGEIGFKTKNAASKSLNYRDKTTYPGYLKDLIGYGIKDFELIEIL